MYLKMKKISLLLAFSFWLLAFNSEATVKVVTTLPDLASIAQYVGGNKVEVSSIATGFQNPHFVDPKPSYIIKLTNADLYVTVGLDLESGWSPQLLTSSRNPKIQKGNPGYVDASEGISLMNVPSAANRELGDIHAFGNPHYWLDPMNGKIMARNICDGLERVDAADKDYFEANLKAFDDKIDSKMKEWQAEMAPLKGTPLIVYHDEWVYFATRFGVQVVDFMEPKPGIPPTPSQLVKVINEVKANHIKVIVSSPYFTTESSDVVAKQTGAKVLTLATESGAFPEVKDYFDLFDYDISQLVNALK
jgi:zinc/manganese transport system substrate-binding protein